LDNDQENVLLNRNWWLPFSQIRSCYVHNTGSIILTATLFFITGCKPTI